MAKTTDEINARRRRRYAANREQNRARARQYDRGYRETNREKKREYMRKWRRANLEKRRGYWRRALYGITTEDFERMLAAQDRRCAICGFDFTDIKAVNIDHDHATGRVRALLCAHCNRGLGLFRESVEYLQRAVDYLKRFTPE